MRIIVGKFIIVEQWCFQKRHDGNTRAVKTINTSPSVIFRHLTRESEMWFIQALGIVFHENVPEEVLELSCSWFLGIFEGISGLKSNFRKHAKLEYRISASFSLGNISSQQVTVLSL